ncbi:MAG: hypothetical protein IMZ66_02040 [Planctomycetes bacterium]|nr:hypothetical protein [Planctomycetota bacterium]
MTRPGALGWMIAVAALAALAGCVRPVVHPRKPQLYAVRGRVVDGATGQGLAYVRVLLRASLDTSVGPRTLAAYGVTTADGAYSVELSETFDVVRYATQIRLDATKRGYVPGWIEIPPPDAGRPVHAAADLVLVPGGEPVPDVPPPGPGTMPGILRRAPRDSPVPWQRGPDEP